MFCLIRDANEHEPDKVYIRTLFVRVGQWTDNVRTIEKHRITSDGHIFLF